jgi:lipopolysaccharide biosynthesis regulator YciM
MGLLAFSGMTVVSFLTLMIQKQKIHHEVETLGSLFRLRGESSRF